MPIACCETSVILCGRLSFVSRRDDSCLIYNTNSFVHDSFVLCSPFTQKLTTVITIENTSYRISFAAQRKWKSFDEFSRLLLQTQSTRWPPYQFTGAPSYSSFSLAFSPLRSFIQSTALFRRYQPHNVLRVPNESEAAADCKISLVLCVASNVVRW